MKNRRDFLSRATWLTASTAGLPVLAQANDVREFRPGQRPRHIIHIVSDGMSAGTLSCAHHLSLQLRGRALTWVQLCGQSGSKLGLMNTRSLNSLVTDSAAASSSWGSGCRVINGTINRSSKDVAYTTLYELMGQAGWKRGLVTTAEITHATPAGFATSVKKRAMATSIAAQYLQREIEVLLGGGSKFFQKDYRLDQRDLYAEYRQAGYHVMRSAAELAVAPTRSRWLGTFARSHLPFSLDHWHDAKARVEVPTLAAMTAAALRRLENESHFILQVEGARVDHACHNNDAAGALHDQIALDEAIDVCLEFQKRVPDTLIVLTTDHGNSNLGLNGTGDTYVDTNKLFARVADCNSSFAKLLLPLKRRPLEEALDFELDDEAEKKKEAAKSSEQKDREAARKKKDEENVATPTEIVELVQSATGYKMPYRKAELLRLHLSNAGESLYDVRKSDLSALGDVLANHWGIGFTGNTHTSDYVPVLAVGPGAERFTGLIENTDVFSHYLHLAGIDFRNPAENLTAQTQTILDAAPENTDEYQFA